MIAAIWPDYEFVRSIEASNELLARQSQEAAQAAALVKDIENMSSKDKALRDLFCAQAERIISSGEASSQQLRKLLDSEMRGLRPGSTRGFGPIAETLRRQIADVEASLQKARLDKTLNC
jgi:hypothetical protein